MNQPVLRGAKVYIAPIEGGFETWLAAAMIKKRVPLVIVSDRAKADYEISALAKSEQATWVKMLIVGDISTEEAAIKVTNIHTDEVLYAYAVRKINAARGKQSAAESCAKHLRERIEGR